MAVLAQLKPDKFALPGGPGPAASTVAPNTAVTAPHRRPVITPGLRHYKSLAPTHSNASVFESTPRGKGCGGCCSSSRVRTLLSACTIHPASPRKLAWDWLIVVLVLYNAIMVPVQISFAPKWATHASFVAFDTLVDILFWIDFGVNLLTGFMDKWGLLVTEKK